MKHTVCNHTQAVHGTVPFIMVSVYTTRMGWNSQSGWLSSQLSTAFVTLGGHASLRKSFSHGGGALFFRDITEAFRDITEAFV